jgi:hypothetical protein
MAINTLITIRDAIQAFVDGHGQLQSVGFGADDKRAPYLTEQELFPVLYVAPVDVEVGRAHNTHRLRVYVYERLNDADQDEWENANDTSLILRDIRVWWNDYGVDDILIETDPTGTFKTDSELDNLVGYYAEILFQIPSHGRCDVPVDIEPVPPVVCAPANYVVEYADGTPIESGSIPSGGFEMVIVPNCPPVDPSDVFINGVEIGTTTNGEQFDITVEQGGVEVGSFIDGVWVVPACEPCEDAKAFLKDTDGNILSITNIPSGTSEDIIAPDGTFDINGVQVATILSGGSDSIEVRRASGSTQVGSLQGQHWRVANTTVQLRDSAANNIGAVNSYGAESANNLTAPDGTVTVNRDGVFFATQAVRSNGTATVNVPSDCPAPSLPQGGMLPFKTGQTTVYQTGDDGTTQRGQAIFTLPFTNPYGNTTRYLDTLGGATYADGITLDLATTQWTSPTTGTFMGYVFVDAGGNWAIQVANALAATHGGFSGWRIINNKELYSLTYDNGFVNDSLNHSGLLVPDNNAILTGKTRPNSTTRVIVRNSAGYMDELAKTGSARRIDARLFNFSVVGGVVILS